MKSFRITFFFPTCEDVNVASLVDAILDALVDHVTTVVFFVCFTGSFLVTATSWSILFLTLLQRYENIINNKRIYPFLVKKCFLFFL